MRPRVVEQEMKEQFLTKNLLFSLFLRSFVAFYVGRDPCSLRCSE